jgi:hypothetical protein
MKTLSIETEQFLTNASGKHTAILLDLATYDRLREAEEELADIQAYDKARPKAHAEVAAGQFVTLADYRAGRLCKHR